MKINYLYAHTNCRDSSKPITIGIQCATGGVSPSTKKRPTRGSRVGRPLLRSSSAPALEAVPQAQLQVPLIALPCDFAEGSAARIGIQAAPVRMVEPVERFGAKQDLVPLGDREFLEQSQVPVLEARVVEVVPQPVLYHGSGPRRGEQ